jgi:PAS domain S-box-containing protein
MLGYALDEIDPHVRSWEKLIHPDDRPHVMSVLNRHLDEETPVYETEYRLRTKSGTWKWVLDRGKVFERDENGKPLRAAGTHLDITEHKQAEEALRQSEEMINDILTASSVGLAHAVNRKIVWANEEMRAMFRFTREDQYLDLDTSMLYAGEEEYRRIGKITYEQQQASEVIEFDASFKRHDGSLFYGYVKVNPLDRLDPLKGIIVSIVDITERKQIADALEAEKERLAVTLRSIGDGVITTDVHSNIQTINRAAEELTGWTQAEAFNQPLSTVFNIVNELTREACDNPVDKVLKSGGIVELANHTLLISRDGRELILADSGAPITDKAGNILGVVLVFRDITEKQKLLENTLRAEKLESIGVLAGGIAHDFNNLLSGIFGYIDLAKLTCREGSETAHYLDNVLKTYTRAKNLTQQLLTFSKGGSPIRKTDSLVPILKESTQFALSGSNVVPLFDIAGDLELCDFDGNQLGQVIDNIVINAVQAMPLGGTVTVSAGNVNIKPQESELLKPGKYIHISISDTGIGIPRSILSKIFDPFFTTKQKGTGLGLASAFSIINKHNGEISVESEHDQGATFHIYLPVSKKTITVNTTEKKHFYKGSGKILIMDDEDYIREIAGEILTTLGYSVEFARNGDEALELLKNSIQAGKSFSAAIMDLTIPGGMGGKEAIHLLRKFDQNLPVFVASGYSEDPVMADPAKYGFTDRLFKPFKRTELIELFYRHLGTE